MFRLDDGQSRNTTNFSKTIRLTFAVQKKYNILAKSFIHVPINRQNFDDLIGWCTDRDTCRGVMCRDHELFIQNKLPRVSNGKYE